MTVKDAIAILQKMPNKEVKIMLDCPWCGKSTGVSGITEVVVLSEKRKP